MIESKRFVLWLSGLLLCWFGYSQEKLSPIDLRCDLIAHTDQVFVNGKLSQIPFDQTEKIIEKVQRVTIKSKQPTFSWGIQNKLPETLQTAYQIQIASTKKNLEDGKADLWDSKKIISRKSQAKYNGIALKTETNYYWRVKIWTTTANESNWSKIKGFRTGTELIPYDSAQYPLLLTVQAPIVDSILKDSSRFYDFGKAAFGKLQITVDARTTNDSLIVAFGEVLKEDGRLDSKPGGSRRYRKIIIPLLQGKNTYTVSIEKDQRNTKSAAVLMPDYIGDVYPFRYTNIISKSTIINVEREIATYVFNDYSSHFSSSDPLLNDIWDFCKYSIKATSFTGAYVDGDRERIPYEADAYINQLSHYGVDHEYTMARKSQEYMLFNATWPTEWILTSVLMAYQDYMYTGNSDFIRHYYKELQQKSLTMLTDENGLISTKTGKLNNEVLEAVGFKGDELRDIVDWPHKGILGLSDDDTGETDGFVFTDYNTVVNAYYNGSLQAMSKIAAALGKKEESENYTRLAKAHKYAFNNAFLDKEKGRYKDGISTEHSALHSNMFALTFGLVPKKYVASVTAYTKSRKMACSVYGSQHLLDAVYIGEDEDYGLQLLTSRSDRGWAHAIYDVGTTISMEAWDNKYKPNQDWNHAWGAAPANIIPRKLMGIEPLEPGFEKIRIKPQIADLKWVKIKQPTIKGAIEVSITNDISKGFTMNVQLPANTISEIWVPVKPKTNRLRMNSKMVKAKRIRNFLVVKNVLSGNYTFTLQ